MSRYSFTVDPRLDPDLAELPTAVDVARALNTRCECGHLRGDHYAATAALGSIGNSACELCRSCPTYRPADTQPEPPYPRRLIVDWTEDGQGIVLDPATGPPHSVIGTHDLPAPDEP